jgi:hypothetical protein
MFNREIYKSTLLNFYQKNPDNMFIFGIANVGVVWISVGLFI